ncbi:hypothetical protein [Vibrio sp. 1F255]|uniref:hypothetical protein n=1 Tax=Vibrio sp. 1F255 TaxID=3230009 RepID=UPI00352E8AC7
MVTHKDIKQVSYLKSKDISRQIYADKKDVFWPFYLWRVLAPKSKPMLNVFQTLILKLVKAGCKNRESLHEYSNLDPELIQYILVQLAQSNYMESWELTQDGLDILKGELTDSKERTSYYLIQDAFTGRLIPRVLNDIPHIEGMDFSQKFPGYIASKSSGRKVTPLLLSRGILNPTQPLIEDMSYCIREHRRELNQFKQADFYVPEQALGVKQNVELIEEQAIPVYVHLSLFSPIAAGERLWYLSDPSGLTHTVPELNEIAEQVAEGHKEFAERVESVIGIASSDHMTTYQQKLQEFEEKAKLELLSSYSWVKKDALIEKHLLAMLRLKKQVESESNPKFELLDGLLNELQKVLEAWLKSFIRPDKRNRDWHVLVYRWEGDKAIMNNNQFFKEKIFLQVNGVSSQAASQLSTSNSGNIRGALTFGNQSLKPMLVAMLLKYPEAVEQLNALLPDWIDKAIQLANVRNTKSAHAGGQTLTKPEALEHLDNTEKLLKVLENLLGNN